MELDFQGIDLEDNFDEFFGSRAKRQERLEKRLARREERKDKRKSRKQERQDARDLRRATRMGLSLEEYRALDSEEVREMESQINEQDLSKRPIKKPIKMALNKAKKNIKGVANEVEDEVDILESDIETGLEETENASANFLAKNKNMLIIGAVAVVGFFVVRKFLK